MVLSAVLQDLLNLNLCCEKIILYVVHHTIIIVT
jgi:hypothetical protein